MHLTYCSQRKLEHTKVPRSPAEKFPTARPQWTRQETQLHAQLECRVYTQSPRGLDRQDIPSFSLSRGWPESSDWSLACNTTPGRF